MLKKKITVLCSSQTLLERSKNGYRNEFLYEFTEFHTKILTLKCILIWLSKPLINGMKKILVGCMNKKKG